MKKPLAILFCLFFALTIPGMSAAAGAATASPRAESAARHGPVMAPL